MIGRNERNFSHEWVRTMKMLFQRCSMHENMKKRQMAPRFWIPPRQPRIHGVIDEAEPSPKHNHAAVNTFTALLPRLVSARLLGRRSISLTGYSLNPKQIGFRCRRREASSAGPSPRRRSPVNRPHMAAGSGRGLRASATYVVQRLRGDIPRTPPLPCPEHGDGIDRRRSRFYRLDGQKKWEGDSCQSSLIVAPLNSGVNGFLPDVNTA